MQKIVDQSWQMLRRLSKFNFRELSKKEKDFIADELFELEMEVQAFRKKLYGPTYYLSSTQYYNED